MVDTQIEIYRFNDKSHGIHSGKKLIPTRGLAQNTASLADKYPVVKLQPGRHRMAQGPKGQDGPGAQD